MCAVEYPHLPFPIPCEIVCDRHRQSGIPKRLQCGNPRFVLQYKREKRLAHRDRVIPIAKGIPDWCGIHGQSGDDSIDQGIHEHAGLPDPCGKIVRQSPAIRHAENAFPQCRAISFDQLHRQNRQSACGVAGKRQKSIIEELGKFGWIGFRQYIYGILLRKRDSRLRGVGYDIG